MAMGSAAPWRQDVVRKLAAAMTESADAGERSRGLFILGASAEPNEAVLPLAQLCRESPSARASEMLACMYGFLGEFSQVRGGHGNRVPGPRVSLSCSLMRCCYARLRPESPRILLTPS